jgi:hypothetical protein
MPKASVKKMRRRLREAFSRYAFYWHIEKLKLQMQKENHAHCQYVLPVLEDLQDDIEQWAVRPNKDVYKSRFAQLGGNYL